MKIKEARNILVLELVRDLDEPRVSQGKLNEALGIAVRALNFLIPITEEPIASRKAPVAQWSTEAEADEYRATVEYDGE